MNISLSLAKAQLTELVRRAEAGEEIILTRHGQPAVRLVPATPRPIPGERTRIIEALQKEVAAIDPGPPGAARSQDFLYGDDGLPA
jgi:prevent-host-death family protein